MHSHILPGIDDGPVDLEESLQLLQRAAADGVRLQVLTPYIHIGRYENTKASLQAAFADFSATVAAAGIGIELRLAAEVRIGAEILQLVAGDDIPWLGGWDGRRVLLLEFPHSQIPVGSINLVQWLIQRQVVPMVAHPERNRELLAQPDKLEPFLQAGCLTQVTAGSLTGKFGPGSRAFAENLLQAGQVTLLATDCHNLAYRPPELGAGRDAAAALIGEAGARRLVEENPQRILEGVAGDRNPAPP